jgi:hypothetical protein
MQKTFHDILTEVSEAKTRKDKIAVLHANSSAGLKQILGYTFDPNVKWLIPEGTPPYKPLPPHSDQEQRLQQELRRLYLFVEGPTDTQKNLKQIRREALFIELLESIDSRDAELLIAMKDGKLPYKGVTRKLVAEAFPNLAKNWF